MPLPDPGSYDNKTDFMHDCVSQEVNNGHPQDQAVAMCLDQWRGGKSRKADSMTMHEGESRDEFMARCTAKEGMDEQQCSDMWDEHHKPKSTVKPKKDLEVEPRTGAVSIRGDRVKLSDDTKPHKGAVSVKPWMK